MGSSAEDERSSQRRRGSGGCGCASTGRHGFSGALRWRGSESDTLQVDTSEEWRTSDVCALAHCSEAHRRGAPARVYLRCPGTPCRGGLGGRWVVNRTLWCRSCGNRVECERVAGGHSVRADPSAASKLVRAGRGLGIARCCRCSVAKIGERSLPCRRDVILYIGIPDEHDLQDSDERGHDPDCGHLRRCAGVRILAAIRPAAVVVPMAP
jgi:hypothetical protein